MTFEVHAGTGTKGLVWGGVTCRKRNVRGFVTFSTLIHLLLLLTASPVLIEDGDRAGGDTVVRLGIRPWSAGSVLPGPATTKPDETGDRPAPEGTALTEASAPVERPVGDDGRIDRDTLPAPEAEVDAPRHRPVETVGMGRSGSPPGENGEDEAMSGDHPDPSEPVGAERDPARREERGPERETGHLALAGDPVFPGVPDGARPDREPLLSAGAIHLPRPVYPVVSRRRAEEGRVVVEVKVGPDGRALDWRLDRSSGYERLDRAAMAAVRGAVFSPATGSGGARESIRQVVYTFRLEDRR